MADKMNQDLLSLKIDRSRKTSSNGKATWVLPVCLFLLIAGAIALAMLAPERIGLSGWGAAPHEVQVAVAGRSTTAENGIALAASGYVIPRRRVEVSSKVSGRVEELMVDRGDTVKAGQILARLDSQEIEAQLRQARAAQMAAKARLDEALAGSRPQEIERVRATLEQAEANQQTAKINLDRALKLYDKGVLAKQVLDDSQNAFDVSVAQTKVAAKNLELAQIGTRTEQIELSRAQLAESEASIAWWQTQLDNTVIRAPVSGTVLDRLIEKGEMVTTGYVSGRGAKSALVSIADLKELEVELDINESDIAQVRVGQECQVSPEPYPDKQYKARVREIAPEANRQKATIQVKVAIEDPNEFLRPETNAKVNFLAPERNTPAASGRILVPKEALVSGPALFVIRDAKAVRVPVAVGAESRGRIEIISGLAGGEQVAISGTAGLADGARVTVK
jgi:RND family efflux transporter MFP subunit